MCKINISAFIPMWSLNIIFNKLLEEGTHDGKKAYGSWKAQCNLGARARETNEVSLIEENSFLK